jgi:hypothetical protein
VNRSSRTTVEVRKSDSRKLAVSIRMSRSDVRQVKRLATRLGVRDSDVIRFAIKTMLVKLAPLPDPGVTGRGLVPVFMEAGPELMSHFDLDVDRLATIINEGADECWRVDEADIQLIAMRAIQASFFNLRIGDYRADNGQTEALRESRPEQNGSTSDARSGVAKSPGPVNGDHSTQEQSLRRYLYDKYLKTRFPEVLAQRAGAP